MLNDDLELHADGVNPKPIILYEFTLQDSFSPAPVKIHEEAMEEIESWETYRGAQSSGNYELILARTTYYYEIRRKSEK